MSTTRCLKCGFPVTDEAAEPGKGESATDAVPNIIGMLVHYAIAQEWRPNDPVSQAALNSQDILSALDDKTRKHFIEQITQLLTTYHSMRGTSQHR